MPSDVSLLLRILLPALTALRVASAVPGAAAEDGFDAAGRLARAGSREMPDPERPMIGHQSGDTAVPAGGQAIIRISAHGLEPLSYQWHRNNRPINGATEPSYAFLPSEVSEGGRFHCVVTDKEGRSSRSRPVTLTVQPGPARETRLPKGLSVGPRVGLNVSDFYRDPAAPARSVYKVNYLQVGLGAAWKPVPGWALQADMLFTRKGVAYAFEDHTAAYHLDYLELPLLVRARPGKWMRKSPLSLLAGGYGALLVSAAREEDWGVWKGTESLDRFAPIDYGPVAGMSWQFALFSAEWRYSLGLAAFEIGGSEGLRTNGVFCAMVGMTLFATREGSR